jgi:hypothetical protein
MSTPFLSLVGRGGSSSSSSGSSSSGPLPVHVSLSRACTLRQHQVQPFLASLARHVAGSRAPRAFPLSLEDSGSVIVNESGQRSFLALLVREGVGEVLRLLSAVDAAVAEFGKEAFYAPPLPHASIATVEGDAADAAERAGIPVHRAPVAGGGGTGGGGGGSSGDGATAVELLLLRERRPHAGAAAGEFGRGDDDGGAVIVAPEPAAVGGGRPAHHLPPANGPSPPPPLRWGVGEVCCRVGNTVHRIPLPAAAV